MSEILKSKNVITRKPHRCWGCAKTYPSGSNMSAVSCAEGGTVETIYWCPTCIEYMHRYFDYGDDINFGDILANDPEGWQQIKNEVM